MDERCRDRLSDKRSLDNELGDEKMQARARWRGLRLSELPHNKLRCLLSNLDSFLRCNPCAWGLVRAS